MRKVIKYLILTSIFVVIILLLVKFYPYKLKTIYSFNVDEYTQVEMTITRTDTREKSMQMKTYKPVECTVTDKESIKKITDNILDNRCIPFYKTCWTSPKYQYTIFIQDIKIGDIFDIDYLDNERVILFSTKNKEYGRYKFISKDIDLTVIDEIINKTNGK